MKIKTVVSQLSIEENISVGKIDQLCQMLLAGQMR